MNYKHIDGNIIKDIDSKQGIVTGYFSVFGNVDADGDMIMPGAFTKTLKENGPDGKNRIMHLWQHDKSEPIAKPHVLKEDATGLYFESKLVGTSKGADALKLYEAGIINEHSIGFNTIKEQKADTHNQIDEIRLWEGSSVTWGANDLTRSTGIKAFKDQAELISYRAKIYKAIRDGKYTDETFLLLVDQLEALDNLKTTEPITVTQPDLDEQKVLAMIHILKTKS